MSGRLGIRQLELLKLCGVHYLCLSPDKRADRLVELGLMQRSPNSNAVHCTTDGLRALADAADAGRIKLWQFKQTEPHK